MTRRVIVADDHPLLLHGLADMLRSAGLFDLVEATGSGTRALALVQSLQPDIAVLDVSMPDIGGMEILRAVHANRWPVRVIFLSATLSGKQISDAIDMGVWGLLLKDYATDSLLDCLNQVLAGKKWLPDDLVAKARGDHRSDNAMRLAALTPREREITELVCRGLSNRAIATELGSSEGTVGIHLHNIYGKLDISSRTMLAALNVRYQLLVGEKP